MDSSLKSSTALFDVYLRLRPPTAQPSEAFLEVDDVSEGAPTHVTIKPPADDHRKRAIEKFAFTKVFSEESSQLDIFNGTTILPLIEGVLGPQQKHGRDGLLATLGVTGSGKSHTILGSRTQRGLTQMTLDVLFKSICGRLVQPGTAFQQLAAVDVSEANLLPAALFLESIYGDGESRVNSRAQTPMLVSKATPAIFQPTSLALRKALLRMNAIKPVVPVEQTNSPKSIRPVTGFARITRSVANISHSPVKETPSRAIYSPAPMSSRRHMPQISMLPSAPNLGDTVVPIDQDADYAVVVSMYEVYNDRIFDLLTSPSLAGRSHVKDMRRRPLLFKSTEYSPDRKVVAGLRKVVCGTLEEALMILETGLTERRVAGTGTNAASSRSHGFFCVEVKKRKSKTGSWTSSTLTIVDLAGSERARTAKTTGSTLAEAGKINESLMYLGQCMQMQASADESRSLVPIRHCKLTELLFSNSLPPSSAVTPSTFPGNLRHTQQQQRAIMIVTADSRGDFNATSQILRYSALAREVTVPRIPSVTSTILSGTTACGTQQRPGSSASSRPQTANSSFVDASSAEEISRLSGELAVLRVQLEDETRRRRDAEASWARAEEKLEDLEAEIRDECWSSFEEQLLAERERWAGAWDKERERNEGHLDSKLELMMRGVGLEGGAAGSAESELEDRVDELERENEVLRAKVADMERERTARTPSRKLKVLKARKWNVEGDEENVSP